MLAIKTIFVQGSVPGFRPIIVFVLSVTLIVADARFDQLTPVRSAIGTGLAPVHWLGNAPGRFSDWLSSLFTTRDDLLEKNEALKARLLILERRALKYAALASENNSLRQLLNSADALDDRVIVGEVVAVSPDPFSHEIIINKGSRDGVKAGQAILDANGLMGQVRQTSSFTSRVLLVSDSNHAVPVEVLRNGVRAILLGNGDPDALELVHVPDTADIRVGDVLVSSGLGGRFPRGYPVAQVDKISKEPGEPFVEIQASPKARLNRSRLVLVVFTPEAKESSAVQSDDGTEPIGSESSSEPQRGDL